MLFCDGFLLWSSLVLVLLTSESQAAYITTTTMAPTTTSEKLTNEEVTTTSEEVTTTSEEVTTTPQGVTSTTSSFCEELIEEELSEEEINHLQQLEEDNAQTVAEAQDQSSGPYAPLQNTVTGASGITRKEYRQMTEQEIKDFNDAATALKNNLKYHEFVEHHVAYPLNAHAGLAFLPWHRHYLFLFEQALRGEKASATIPYWDSSLDQFLPAPQDAAVWTEHYWGNNDGPVTKGPFADWPASQSCKGLSDKLKRKIDDDKNFLYTDKKMKSYENSNTYKDLMLLKSVNSASYESSDFEAHHGVVHCWVGTCGSQNGGHMGDFRCSPVDPVFWMHHAFVDYLWDEWKEAGGDNTYPTTADVSNKKLMGWKHKSHRPGAKMEPFSNPEIKNKNGMKSDFYPKYQERPSKIACTEDDDCNSPIELLWCHKDLCRCFAKIKEGGSCDGLEDHDNACYCHNSSHEPKCNGGTCECE